MNAPIDITAHFSMNIASASKHVLSSLLLPPLFRAASFSGDSPVLAILLPTDTIFDTEQRKLGFSFESSTASKFTDWTNIDASFDLIMMLFVSIFINSIDGNWDEKKDFPGR